MSNPIAEKMLEEKRKRSPFLTLKDKESATGQVKLIKEVEKTGFSGDLVQVLRMVLVVDMGGDIGEMDKNFDNGSASFLNEIVDKDVQVGDEIKITREGEGNKTKYKIEVLTKGGKEEDSKDEPEAEEPKGPEEMFD